MIESFAEFLKKNEEIDLLIDDYVAVIRKIESYREGGLFVIPYMEEKRRNLHTKLLEMMDEDFELVDVEDCLGLEVKKRLKELQE